jgi:hypothetical protein
MAAMDQLIKKAAVDAIKALKPSDVTFGKVLSLSPLKIQIDQKLTLDDDFIVLTQTVNGTLVVGDRVVMIMAQGGQIYVVLDKVV